MTTRLHPLRARLVLPFDRPPKSLVGNSRSHWRARSADTRTVREAVLVLARSAGLHGVTSARHVTATFTWAPGDNIRRDADNLWPMLKACCDALARGPRRDWVGLQLVPDDTPAYFTKNAPVIWPPPREREMWLDLLIEFGDDPEREAS